MGSYIEIGYAVFLNLWTIRWETNGLYFNNMCMFLGVSILVFFPIFLLIFLSYNFSRLNEASFLEKYSNAYLDNPFRSSRDLTKHVTFFLSRIAIILTFTVVNDPASQIILLMGNNLIRMSLNGAVRPYTSTNEFRRA